ncbi:hypothetical protein OWR29_42635 [Actinoplanes sp. Pm04-4]|uniref:Uncharacterized protein n=1 Tax=Paractinoplanes pyxinae TaxID=2997416 RepID=A0ABT4BDZ0_9ACTN|nr:hypothetical protein [Actinoplanes pyxinae]MCY1144738.1 hypothetical protein [Actinoplanes pyxinae]
MGEPERRRRRLRPSSGSATPAPPPAAVDETTGAAAVTEPIADPAPDEAAPVPAPVERMVRPSRNGGHRRQPPGPNGGGNGDDRELERGLRGLVGSGSSQVSVGAALRARDAARPTEDDLADADRNLTIVRRNWVPREELPRNR